MRVQVPPPPAKTTRRPADLRALVEPLLPLRQETASAPEDSGAGTPARLRLLPLTECEAASRVNEIVLRSFQNIFVPLTRLTQASRPVRQ